MDPAGGADEGAGCVACGDPPGGEKVALEPGPVVCLALAELYPQHIRNLILLNSTPKADSNERQRNRDRAIEALSENADLFIGMAITNLFSPKNWERYALHSYSPSAWLRARVDARPL